MKWLELAVRRPYLTFSCLAVLILGPLLLPGYVLTLDMVFAPNTTVPSIHLPGFPFYGFLWLLNTVLPGDVVQKIVLVAIFILSGCGATYLARWLQPQKTPLNWPLVSMLAGLLYACNPFVYSRLMAGQFMVLLGYALLPFFVLSWLRLLQKPQMRTGLVSSVWAAAIAVVSLHTFGMAVLFAALSSLVTLWQVRARREQLMATGKYTSLAGGLIVLLSLYWLIPFLLGNNHTAELVSSFNSSDRSVFATAGTGWQKIWYLITLQGFWADSQSLYVTAGEIFAWWNVIAVAVLGLVATGLVTLWRTSRAVAVVLFVMLSVSIVLACGTNGTIFAPFNTWLLDVFPPLAGYREPQKFVAAMALVYAVSAATGLGSLWAYVQKHKHPIGQTDIAIVMVALTILYAPLQFWGLHGQLHATEYPQAWYTANARLMHQPKGDVLFLPWHQYMRFSFAQRIVANPASAFFDAPIVSSNNPELKGLNHWTNTHQQQALEQYILPHAMKGGHTFAADLQQIGIKYVIVVQEYDYQKYQFVSSQPGLHQLQSGQLALYEVRP
jgi:hypothetical protein